ncbi:Precorrin-6Y C(5,15)-methyltransferase [decarboxylating] [Pseudobythopirellula maris]|uniref:Precorrin-6Y C(5,15)-methyltransferase [decarboxylating] n=1 Tax=Pseudobythopirellula maris TaxID=2527991 RepID=A0A5C5ZWU2_9BACT|nr:precorrin-6y C5,15-methyltransferase (decarboxylating) subunit CbiE [Pseudobythopirellula maris]TWT90773.1 Precorrin-6Y C(5,15)-methyltransferase [decarboxylating] [Pseudobythopirellula maris]
MPPISIIGIGDDGLSAASGAVRECISSAQVLLGDERALMLLAEAAPQAERAALSGDLDEIAAQIEAIGDRPAAIVVFGDPMFYGLARFLTDHFGKDRFQVLPHVSSMQLAFARVMESWDEAYLTSLATKPLDAVVERIRTSEKVGLFTTDRCGPEKVARALLDKEIDYFTAYVCENLGARDERVTLGELPEIAEGSFPALNVMILIRKPNAPDRPSGAIGRRTFGNPDEAFLQAKPKQGLLTPAEVRSLALAQMDIAAGSIVWDVGAGSGSVSVEAAQLASDGAVYAIEMDPEDHGLIQQNAERFHTANVVPILGKAPEAWAALPDPDCVFLAGSGREVTRLSTSAYERLRSGGRLVVNLISIDNLTELRLALLEQGQPAPDVRVWMVNIARGADQLGRLSFEPLKPNFLLAALKP